jgi:hypothetical protein
MGHTELRPQQPRLGLPDRGEATQLMLLYVVAKQ